MTRKKTGLSKAERRTQALEKLASYKLVERKTNLECAGALGVSPRTIDYYLADEEYHAIRERLLTEWRAGAEFHVAQLAQTALQTIADLMSPDTKSEFVRFQAAQTIGNWLGLGVKEVETQQDDRKELERLAELMAARPTQQINVFTQPVEPGGFLPPGLQRAISAEEFLNGTAKLTIVEADA